MLGAPTTALNVRVATPPRKTVTRRVARCTTISHGVGAFAVARLTIHPLCPFGRPGRRTRSHVRPRVSTRRPITGSRVRSPVSGRSIETRWTTRECRIGLERAV